MKNPEFIIHLIGLAVLTFLIIFFGLLEKQTNREFIDIGILVGIIGTIVTGHAANKLKKDDP